jgi:hypothetical protein
MTSVTERVGPLPRLDRARILLACIRAPFRHVRLVPLAEDLLDQAPLVKPRSLDIIVPTRTR